MNNNKPILLLTGSTGMVGLTLSSILKKTFTVVEMSRHLRKTDVTYPVDFASETDYVRLVDRINPHVIVHLAAITDPEFCESHRSIADRVNIKSTEKLLQWARKKSIHFVYMSSSGIFDGEKSAYKETDIPHPITYYGKTKYMSEQMVQTYNQGLIVRASWVVGGGPGIDKQFVGMILKAALKGTDTLHIVKNKYGSLSYVPDISEHMHRLITEKASGIYHLVAKDCISRLDIAQHICSLLDLPIHLFEVDESFFSREFKVRRPNSECLIPQRLLEESKYMMRPWRYSLGEYIQLWQ